MTWNNFRGKLIYGGTEYHSKGAEFEKVISLPRRTNLSGAFSSGLSAGLSAGLSSLGLSSAAALGRAASVLAANNDDTKTERSHADRITFCTSAKGRLGSGGPS